MEPILSIDVTCDTADDQIPNDGGVTFTVRLNARNIRTASIYRNGFGAMVEHHDTGKLRFTVAVTEERKLGDAPTKICIENAAGIGLHDLDRLPWSKLLDASLSRAQLLVDQTVEHANIARKASEALADTRPRRAGRPGRTTEQHQQIANEYAELVDSGDTSPALAIAANHAITHDNARRWIRQARKLGHLPPARTGKAGWK